MQMISDNMIIIIIILMGENRETRGHKRTERRTSTLSIRPSDYPFIHFFFSPRFLLDDQHEFGF